ncbi:MAG: TraM recognition domain-containing protein, partial [Alphaproteobacteria bacterium]|nr:TraM recognition domain-containing protein [Alphaproteobacteria bacterium]
IKEAFQQDAEALIGGCSLLVYGGSNEIGWLERISKLLGKRTSYGRSESASQHGSSQGRSETPTNLRNLDQIAAMAFMNCILIVPGRAKVDGLKPFKLVKRFWRKTVLEFYQ